MIFNISAVNGNSGLGPHVLILFVCVFCDSFLCSISLLLLSGSPYMCISLIVYNIIYVRTVCDFSYSIAVATVQITIDMQVNHEYHETRVHLSHCENCQLQQSVHSDTCRAGTRGG